MRLIDTKKKLSFKNWIKQHDPKYPWNFNDPQELIEQFCEVVGTSGDIDLKTLFHIFFTNENTGLSSKKNSLFLYNEY